MGWEAGRIEMLRWQAASVLDVAEKKKANLDAWHHSDDWWCDMSTAWVWA